MCKGHGSRSFIDQRMGGGISSGGRWRHVSACTTSVLVVISTATCLGLLANGPCKEIGRVFEMHQVCSGIPAFVILIVMMIHAIMAVTSVVLVCYRAVVDVIARFVKSHGFTVDGT